MTNKTAVEILDAIKAASTVMICGHIRPDGDCIGSAMAMRHLCEKLGKKADAVCDAEKPSAFAFLPEYGEFCAPRYDSYDLFIAVDCATEKRLGVYGKYLRAAKKSVHIDHHPVEQMFADINCIRVEASSVCEVIYTLFADSGLIDKDMATMLYTGLSTDTGHFMHSNTTSEVFKIASELCAYGIDIAAVNHGIYKNKSINRIKLTARALEGIELYENGRIALMTITRADMTDCGCGTDDTEGLIDYASSIAGVEISICVCEQEGGTFRTSLRSVRADVSKVAGMFGGGGHKLASGCILSGVREQVRARLVEAARSAL